MRYSEKRKKMTKKKFQMFVDDGVQSEAAEIDVDSESEESEEDKLKLGANAMNF